MTDEELIAKKLAFIDTCVHELTTLARPDAIPGDVRELRFVEHTLQVAIQAALDVASHIVSDERLGEPANNRELFDLLAGAGYLERSQVAALRDMAGFRNVLVHAYTAVDPGILKDVLSHRLGDLSAFGVAIRRRMAAARA
ncbi:MAG: DUF86 domain-containing protein [Deltaproteobacteria bacterium]|nr:DUF86 domain-containing protein [Deltaproteobacteria bacterium]